MANEIGAGNIGQKAAEVQTFQRKTQDVLDDSLQNARDIGRVSLQRSRLNVFSSVEVGDKEDNFKFAIDSKGSLRLGKSADDEVRIQIFNSARRVIADSKEGMGAATKRFQRLISTEGEPLDRGDYTVKVSRLKPKDTETKYNYSLQLSMGGSFKNDFDTLEYKAVPDQAGSVPSVPVPAAVTMGQGAVSVLAAGMNRFSTLIDGTITIFGRIRGLF